MTTDQIALTAAEREALLAIQRGKVLQQSIATITAFQALGLVTPAIPIRLTALGEEVVERST